MKILVIGNGAREHALVWKIAQSKRVSKIFCAPGNAGIEELAHCVNIRPQDTEMLLNFAKKEEIDLTIVGPEGPLVSGLVDRFKQENLVVFGPNKKGALLEGSKTYAKEFMDKYDIPTAKYKKISSLEEGLQIIKEIKYPIVIKADGLASGKGVVICNNDAEAENTIIDMMENKNFGASGEKVIIEEFLEGVELSQICLVSRNNIIPLESARDYKKAMDSDKGLNTGGMGSYTPNDILTKNLQKSIEEDIFKRIEIGLKEENIDFYGVLFIGFIITSDGPKVLEFNVRFGDPETEVIIPRLESDILDIFLKTIDGSISRNDLKWKSEKCMTVILCSGGYPLSYEVNKKITGLNKLDKDILVFHGGTKKDDSKIHTNGGRVLAITALKNTIEECSNAIYKNIERINFDGMYFRRDIGK